MKAWRLQEENIQCYTAYKEVNGAAKTLGFVHFVEGIVNSKPVVYISHAGVSEQGKGIGRRLMECVLGHYPTGTTFYILTRVFNEEAKTLYKNRLKFEDISLSEIKQLGYDERYCGYKLTSSEALVEDIEQRKAYHQSAPKLGL